MIKMKALSSEYTKFLRKFLRTIFEKNVKKNEKSYQ